MKKNFLKALDKVANKILNMADDDFEKMLEQHKNGLYAKTIDDLELKLVEESYNLNRTKVTVRIDSPKNQESYFSDKEYNLEVTKTINVKDKQNLYGEYECQSQMQIAA